MALADLLRALERDAEAEVRTVTEAAAADVARLEAEAARQGAARLAAALQELADREHLASSGRLADVERRHRRAVLEARREMLARVRAAACAKLPALVDDALRARLAAAAAAFGEGTRRDTATGVIVELADGTLVEASLETVLDGAWPSLAGEVLREVEERAP